MAGLAPGLEKEILWSVTRGLACGFLFHSQHVGSVDSALRNAMYVWHRQMPIATLSPDAATCVWGGERQESQGKSHCSKRESDGESGAFLPQAKHKLPNSLTFLVLPD